jgi:hypothetical protein
MRIKPTSGNVLSGWNKGMVGTLDLITNNMIRYNLSMAEHYIYIYNMYTHFECPMLHDHGHTMIIIIIDSIDNHHRDVSCQSVLTLGSSGYTWRVIPGYQA